MTVTSRDALTKEIAAHEVKLAVLEREREDVRSKLAHLRDELAALDFDAKGRDAARSASASSSMTPT